MRGWGKGGGAAARERGERKGPGASPSAHAPGRRLRAGCSGRPGEAASSAGARLGAGRGRPRAPAPHKAGGGGLSVVCARAEVGGAGRSSGRERGSGSGSGVSRRCLGPHGGQSLLALVNLAKA